MFISYRQINLSFIVHPCHRKLFCLVSMFFFLLGFYVFWVILTYDQGKYKRRLTPGGISPCRFLSHFIDMLMNPAYRQGDEEPLCTLTTKTEVVHGQCDPIFYVANIDAFHSYTYGYQQPFVAPAHPSSSIE